MEVKSIRFLLSDEYKAVLDEIVRRDGDPPMSSVLRRLIRQEGERRGIQLPILDDKNSTDLVDLEPESTLEANNNGSQLVA